MPRAKGAMRKHRKSHHVRNILVLMVTDYWSSISREMPCTSHWRSLQCLSLQCLLKSSKMGKKENNWDYSSKRETEVDHFSNVMAPLHQLTISSSFLSISRIWSDSAREVTTFHDLNFYQMKKSGSQSIPSMKRWAEISDLNTESEKLKGLIYGLFKLRLISNQIHTYILPQSNLDKQKRWLFHTEDTSLIAYLYIYSCAQDGVSRNRSVVRTFIGFWNINLIRHINDDNDGFTMLTIMHQISAQGGKSLFSQSRTIISGESTVEASANANKLKENANDVSI